MKKLTVKTAILLAGAAVLVPFMASAAEPTTGQKPCELDRTIKVQMKYLLALPKSPLSANTWSRPVGRRSWECPCGGNRMLRILSSPATIPDRIDRHNPGTHAMIRCTIFLAAVVLVAPQAPAQDTKTLRVYFVGNSVTDTINYRALAELAKSRGHQQVWGRHMIPGAPLQWIWQHPKDGFQEQPFGHYPTALADHPWDVLSLQPFDRHLDGKDGDLTMAKHFIDLALPKSPDLQVYVYARWPRQGKDDFDTAWLKKYTGDWDGTNETRDYFERLTLELRKTCPNLKKPVLMVPVGHVMYELNQRMKAGVVPGHMEIKDVFADGIHLNNVGSYVVGCTYFATLYRENPKGLPADPYKVTDPKLAEVIQDTVWKVVSTHELAGVEKATAVGGKASFKGWEVYVWQQDGDTYFSLLPGTNRLKTDAEITAAAVKGIDAIKPKLNELRTGEMVFPCGRRLADQAPEGPAKEIRKYRQKLGLDVQT